MTTPVEPVEHSVAPETPDATPLLVAEQSTPNPDYAPVSGVPEGYEVVSHHPVPDNVRKVIANPTSEVTPLLIGFLLSGLGFYIGITAAVSAVVISFMVLVPAILGCYLSIRVGERRKLLLRNNPAVLAMASESDIPADEIAYALYRVANRGRMLPVPVRFDTKVFINMQDFEAGDGILPRALPKDKQSIGLLQRIEG